MKLLGIVILTVLFSFSACSENIGGKASLPVAIDGDGAIEVPDPVIKKPNIQIALEQITGEAARDENVSYQVLVKNSGNALANPFSVVLSTDDGQNIQEDLDSLLARRTFSFTANFSFNKTGDVVVSALADALYEIDESSEDDNLAFITTSVMSNQGPQDYVLEHWSSYFFDQEEFLASFVIGQDADLQLASLATQIIEHLELELEDPIVLAQDIDAPQPLIALGSACDNSLIASLPESLDDCQEYNREGFARIVFFSWEGEPILVLSGASFDEVSLALDILLNHNDSLSGHDLCAVSIQDEILFLDCPLPDDNPVCIESDSGQDFDTFGVVWGWNEEFTSTETVEDYCLDELRLMEQFCHDDGFVNESRHLCLGVCFDGECIEKTSAEGGVFIEGTSLFNIGDSLHDIKETYVVDDISSSFEVYLEDSELSLDDGTVGFSQSLTLPDAKLLFGQDEVYASSPLFYLNLMDSYFEYVISFDQDIDLLHDVSSLTPVVFFGQEYYLIPPEEDDDKLWLLRPSKTIELTQEIEFEDMIDNQEYSITLLSGAVDQEILLKVVKGSVTDTDSLNKGELASFAGSLLVFVEDVFLDDNDVLSAKLQLGGTTLVLTEDHFGEFSELEVYGVAESAYAESRLDASSWEDVSSLTFRVYPQELVDTEHDIYWDWLIWGQSFRDPVFDFGLFLDNNYFGLVDHVFSFDIIGDDVMFSLINERDDSFDVVAFTNNAGTADWGDLVVNTAELSEGDVFILTAEEDELNVSVVYEVIDISSSQASIRSTGSARQYAVGDDIGPATIEDISNNLLVLDTPVSSGFTTKHGAFIELRLSTASASTPKVYLIENFNLENETEFDATALYFFPGQSSFVPFDDGWSAGYTLGGGFNESLFSVSPMGSFMGYFGSQGGFYFGGEIPFDAYLLFPNSEMSSDEVSTVVYDGDDDSYVPLSDEDQLALLQQDSDLSLLVSPLLDLTPPTSPPTNNNTIAPPPSSFDQDYPAPPAQNNMQNSPTQRASPYVSSCLTCYFDGDCYEKGALISSFGEDLYCDGSKFVKLKKGASECVDDYECASGSCSENECEKNFWESFLALVGIN